MGGVWCVGCTYAVSSPWLKTGVMWVVYGVWGARMMVVAHGLNQRLCVWFVVCGVHVMVVVAHGLNQGLGGWCVVCGVHVWW